MASSRRAAACRTNPLRVTAGWSLLPVPAGSCGRARILRNLRDENDDNELDIAPGFIMASGRSDWVSYGRDVRRLGENTGTPIPEPARKLQIRNLSLDAWLNTKDTSTDFGPILSEVLSRTYQTTTGQMTFWNLSRIRSATFSVSRSEEHTS